MPWLGHLFSSVNFLYFCLSPPKISLSFLDHPFAWDVFHNNLKHPQISSVKRNWPLSLTFSCLASQLTSFVIFLSCGYWGWEIFWRFWKLFSYCQVDWIQSFIYWEIEVGCPDTFHDLLTRTLDSRTRKKVSHGEILNSEFKDVWKVPLVNLFVCWGSWIGHNALSFTICVIRFIHTE